MTRRSGDWGDGGAGNEIFRKSTENKNKFLKPGLVAPVDGEVSRRRREW